MSGDDKDAGASTNNFNYQGTDYSHIPVSGDYSQMPFPDGYKPTPKPDADFKTDTDYYGMQQLSGPAQDIENIRMAIKAQQPGTISALADYWVKVVQLLDKVQQVVSQNADALHNGNRNGFGGWSSPAAKEFLRWGPGATLYSIKQWTDAANANVTGLRNLTEAVLQAHSDIDEAWSGYLDESRTAKATILANGAIDPATLPEDLQKTGPAQLLSMQIYSSQVRVWRKWSVKAQNISYELSQKYYTQLENHIAAGRGTRFEGPANAVVDPHVGMPGLSGPPGGPPGPPGGPSGPGSPPGSPPSISGPPSLSPPPGSGPPAELIAVASPPTPPPPPGPPPPPPPPDLAHVPVPVSTPAGPMLVSGMTMALLGLTKPATWSGQLLNATLTGKLTQSPFSTTGLKGMLGKSGVLRPSGMANQSAPPNAMGRPSPNRSNLRAPGEEPENMGSRRAGARGANGELTRAGAPGAGDEEVFGRGLPGTTSPVLSGRRSTGIPSGGAPEEQPGRQGPTRPGTTPSVLKAARAGRSSGAPAEEQFTGQPKAPGTIRPVLGGPTRQRGPVAPERFDEIPHGLRAAHATGPQTEASELNRRWVSADQVPPDAGTPAQENDGARVIGDEEAWAVETPGGSVLGGHTDAPAYQPEHRPTLGGGGNG